MNNYTVTTSAELMENFLQADTLLPQDAFCALQTDTGASLLFAIGTDGIFNVMREVQGDRYGWQRADLSSYRIANDFPHGATCKTFAAAQANASGSRPAQIQLAMVLNDGAADHLYLSLGNPDADLGWTAHPVWTACPFNALDAAGKPLPPPSRLSIADVFISEASDGEFVVVDAIRNPGGPVEMISRFYMDVSNPAAPRWMPHDIAGDIEAEGSASCLGRTAQAFGVDGIYTKGQVGKAAQLLYTPLYNVFNPLVPPAPVRLQLPGGLQADAITACRNTDNTTDLYVAAQSALYLFASDNQRDEAVAVQVATDAHLTGVRALFSSNSEGMVTVWGLNGSDQVFYLRCPLVHAASAGSWSIPVPILVGVDAVSPYIDRGYGANTFFAHGRDGLVKAVKSPGTGLWTRRAIHLPPSDRKQAAKSFSSYTTHVQVNGPDGRPAAGANVRLTAASVTSVLINHLYYVVGPTPIQVQADAVGSLTIVELAHTLAGTQFVATVEQMPAAHVNPMDAPFQRNAKLDSGQSLKSAVITARDGSTRPLVPAGTSQDDLDTVAAANKSLANAYGKVGAAPRGARPAAYISATAARAAVPAALARAGFGSSLQSDLGDLFSWMANGIEAAVEVVEEVGKDVWYLVVKIADQAYHGVLDCAEKIAAAVTWVYNRVKAAVEDVLKYLEFLFDWKDIVTTHRVLRNVLLQLANAAVDGMEGTKSQIVDAFTQMRATIDKWADLPELDQTATGVSSANPAPASLSSAPANLGTHHFKGNCASVSSAYSPPSLQSTVDAVFKDLVDLLEKEGDVMSELVETLKTQVIDQVGTLSLKEILKRLLAAFADTVLETAQNVVVTFVDVVIKLARGFIQALNASLDIPVLSSLYRDLTGDELSFLDALCLVAAIPVTIVSKLAGAGAPFPQGDAFTNSLISARSFDQVRALFFKERQARSLTRMLVADKVINGDGLKNVQFIMGIVAFVGSVCLATVMNMQRVDQATEDSVFAKPLAVLACASNLLYLASNFGTVINIQSGTWADDLDYALTLISIGKSLVAIGLAGGDEDVDGAMAFVESFINVVWNVPVIYAICEYAPYVATTRISLIPYSEGNFMFNAGGILEYMIYKDKDDPDLVALQAILMVGYGLFMVLGGGIYRFAPGQDV